MIERSFISQKMKEYLIEEFIASTLKNVGHSHTRMMKTPMGEKIVIYASRPGLIVGQKGANIRELTETIKKKFGLENPQIEIIEVENVNLDAQIVAEKIASSLERFGTAKMKGIAHKVLTDTMGAGALGIELHISGKIPSSRAKSWRFYQGYMKKCGNIAMVDVRKAIATAFLKTGNIGIKVNIMPPDIILPDRVNLIDDAQLIVNEKAAVAKAEEKATKDKEAKEKRQRKKPEKKAKLPGMPEHKSSEQKVENKEAKPAENPKTEVKVETK